MADEKSLLNPDEMLDYAIAAAKGKATSVPAKSFLLALTAGGYIGIGFTFFLISQMGAAGAMPLGMAKVVGGIVFSTGLALVVLTGAELFTSSTLTLTAKATGEITWLQLLRNWAVVWVGNFLGSLTLVALEFLGGVYEQNGGAMGAVLLKTAEAKVSHSPLEAFFLGILCNLLVCVAVWVTYAGRTAVDKIAALTLPIAMFVVSCFEHSVANMFLLPFAMIVKDFAPAEFWSVSKLDPASFTHLTWQNVFVNNLIPVTLGNIVGGGLMIGMMTFVIYKVVDHPSVKR